MYVLYELIEVLWSGQLTADGAETALTQGLD
jgi:hypothetical protein